MYTVIKQYNNIVKIFTQSYTIATYVCIYENNRFLIKFNTSMSEIKYHKHIRINAIKSNQLIVDGTILDCKSRYKINNFNKIQ